MTEVSYRSLVWLTYRLGATFAFGVPLVILIWSSIKKESSIIRLLAIYWKVSSLILISMLLLNGNRPIGFLTSFFAPLLVLLSVWFWIDLNEELQEMPKWKALALAVKTWRWSVSVFAAFYITLSSFSLNCLNNINNTHCNYWSQDSLGLNQIIKTSFNFLFGANWTDALSAFLGYITLIIYTVGFIQWMVIRLPKQGRIAGDF